jgi:phage shock protein PspC (stress-responsive transcriptional regulator)
MNKLCKIEKEGKISGVCAGLARYFNIDVTIIRIIWLVALFMGIGSPVLIYIVMALVMPECDPNEVSFVAFDDEKEEEDPYNTDERY